MRIFAALIAWALIIIAIVLWLGSVAGCAGINITVEKPDGTVVRGSGFSILKDHGLEGFTYKRRESASTDHKAGLFNRTTNEHRSSEAEIGVDGYRSQSRLDAILKLIEELK